MKTIYLEPPWTQPFCFQSLMLYPTQGYQFITKELPQEKLFKLMAKTDFEYTLHRWFGGVVPLWLAKSFLEKFRAIPEEADLTYALLHIVFRKEPWVLDIGCDQPHLLVGDERQFNRYKGTLRRALTSEYCKRIICWVEAGKRALLSRMDGEELESKIEVVNWAVPEKHFIKEYQGNRVKLLFVNSANINNPWHFQVKGGKEVLEAFLELNRRYDNLELVMRSGVPQPVKEKYRQVNNIKIMDKPVPWEELEQEWKSADIFILPTHVTPAMVFLDAMSYELPIVTTDVWANPEIVADGKAGFIVPDPELDQYIDNWVVHYESPAYKRAVKIINPKMVQALVEKISILIENPELRRSMGKAGRWEVEQGRFSLRRRNEKLKRIFDEATSEKA